MSDVVIAVAVVVMLCALTLGFLLVFLRGQRRDHAAAGSAEIVTAMNRLPTRVNWRIARAIRAGSAVDDPALARLAADRAAHAARINDLAARRIRRYWWAYALAPLLYLVSLGLNLAAEGLSGGNAIRAGFEILLVCCSVSLPWWLRRTARRAHAAAGANQTLAAQHPEAAWTGRALDPVRTRLRRSVLVWVIGIAVFTPVDYLLFRLLGEPYSWAMTAVFTILIFTAVIAASWYIAPAIAPSPVTRHDRQ